MPSSSPRHQQVRGLRRPGRQRGLAIRGLQRASDDNAPWRSVPGAEHVGRGAHRPKGRSPGVCDHTRIVRPWPLACLTFSRHGPSRSSVSAFGEVPGSAVNGRSVFLGQLPCRPDLASLASSILQGRLTIRIRWLRPHPSPVPLPRSHGRGPLAPRAGRTRRPPPMRRYSSSSWVKPGHPPLESALLTERPYAREEVTV